MIDIPFLERDGILPEGTYHPLPNAGQIDFEAVKAQHAELLGAAYAHARERMADEIDAFAGSHPWARDYALFRTIKEHFDLVSWMEWPDEDIRLRKPEAVARYSEELKDRVGYYLFEQVLFFRQWSALHDYARANGVELMGDMPIYVAEDSADVWLNPELFELDEDCRPIRIAGVPPDYFQADGQRWGNPLYRWGSPRGDELRLVDRPPARRGANCSTCCASTTSSDLRTTTPSRPASRPRATASTNSGRTASCSAASGRELPNLKIVAEDLGVVSPRVKRLLKFCGYPGMKVLQFAFDSDDTNVDLPQNHTENCIVYTGTHDNNTTLGWWGARQRAGQGVRARKARHEAGQRSDPARAARRGVRLGRRHGPSCRCRTCSASARNRA